MLDRSSQHDSQFAIAMLKSNLLDLIGVDEGFEVDNLWIFAFALRPSRKQKSRGAFSADRVADDRFQRVIDVIASRANLDGKHECLAIRICADEIDCALQGGKSARTSQSRDGRSLYAVTESHVRNQAAAYIRTDVACAAANCQKVQFLHRGSSRINAIQNRSATGFHSSAQIALIQLVRTLLAIQRAFQIKMPIVDIAIQKYLPNALALVTRRMKGLLLGEPDQRVRCSETDNARMVHCSPTNSWTISVLPL